jgi:hypothetical protein
MPKTKRALIMALIYFTALLAYGRSMAPVVLTSSFANHHQSLKISYLSASTKVEKDDSHADLKIVKFKRRKRRVSHFDVIENQVITEMFFWDVNWAHFGSSDFRWTLLDPPTPPPC